MFVKVKVEGDGPGPSEKIISVKTSEGEAELLIVSHKILQQNTVEVGLPLAFEAGRVLIELPRESTSGRWRIWIPESEIENLVAAE